jgi:hypothetical protein
MFIRQFFQTRNGRRNAYWALVESYRTPRGPRQRVVAWLGKLDEAGRLGLRAAAEQVDDPGSSSKTCSDEAQLQFDFDRDGGEAENPPTEPRWVEVNANVVRVENLKQFGGPWLALELIRRLQLDTFLERVLPQGRERVPWSLTR